MGGDNLNEEKLEELLTLMRSVVPDISDMNDAGKVGFVYKKDYSPDTTYEESDIVLYNMTLWIAKTDTTGNPPPDQSQEGQEEVNENEFWELFLPGVLGKDYVKKTDYAQPGIAGVVQPDGKTIKVGKKGLLTGAAAGFTGTLDEFKAALAAGELSPGDIVNITDDYVAVPPGSLFISGTTEEINAMLAAGEIEDGTIVIITDDYTDPASITRSEFDTVAQATAENKQHLAQKKNLIVIDTTLPSEPYYCRGNDTIEIKNIGSEDNYVDASLLFQFTPGTAFEKITFIFYRAYINWDSNTIGARPAEMYLSYSKVKFSPIETRLIENVWLSLPYLYESELELNRYCIVTLSGSVYNAKLKADSISGTAIMRNNVTLESVSQTGAININIVSGSLNLRCNLTGRIIDQNGNDINKES